MNQTQQRLKKISYIIVSIYFVIGLLDLISFRDSMGAKFSLLDALFVKVLNVQKERTYTEPFGLYRESKHFEKPKGLHILGTDINGNDVLLQTLKGAKTALLLAIGVNLIAIPIGIVLGVIAGYFGGWIDDIIQWFYTTVASIPWLLFVITFLMIFGRGMIWIIIAIGLTSWVELARIARGETLKLREMNFIKSSLIVGKSHFRILWEEILPNLSSIVKITFALSSSHIIVAETVLTFIGIGIEPGSSSWGIMIAEAPRELLRDPPIWWNFFSASFLGILPLILALNILAEER
ncbi:MAG: ABC transporter permease [Leptospiraceae bacterium]|nr:ABC transporter permease [Leptospiraceae bacterium]MDW7975256.1 ABC transporter permease [Leptospiraceae bacterium]